MRKHLLFIMFLVALLGTFTTAFAENYVIGSGTTSGYYLPAYGYYDYSWGKMIYLASELTTAGMAADTEITGIGFNVANTPANFEMLDQRIYLRQTSQSIYGTATDETGTGYPNNANFNQVFQASYTYNGGGWHYLFFNEPFVWDGTSNIEILYESWDTYGVSGYPTFRYTSTSSNYRGVYKYQDGSFPTTYGSRTYNRPNITFITPSVDPPQAATLNYPADGGSALMSAILSWTPGGGMPTSYNVYLGTSESPDFVQNQVSTSYAPVLEEDTTYYWQIVPVNANGEAEGCPVWSFHTPRSTQLAEDFEVSVPAPGWANPGSWFRTVTTYKTGIAGMYKGCSSSTQYTISMPKLSIDEASTLDFWTSASSTSAILQIVYSEDRLNWTQLGENITYASVSGFSYMSIDLSQLAGNDYYLGFRTGLATGSVYIDALVGPEITQEIPGPVTQSLPADLATGIFERPTFTWTAPVTGGLPIGYNIYCDTNPDPYTLIGTTTALTYTSTVTLDYNTQYYWKVAAYNMVGESESNLVRSFTVREDPTIYPPATQDFATFPPANWVKLSGLLTDPITLTSTTSGWVSDGFANVGSSGSAKINIFGTSYKYWLVTPQINLGSSKAEWNLEFNLALTDYGTTGSPELTGTDDKFAVVISTDGGATWSTANILRLWDNAGSSYVYNNISYTGELVSISLAGYSGAIAIGFYGESTVSNADNDLFVDNFAIIQAGAPPTAPTAGVPSNNATDVYTNTNLSWSGASGNPTGYLVYMGTSPELEQVADVSTPIYDPAELLNYGTTYYWRVDTYNEYGSTEGPVWQFTTVADPTIYAENLPYYQNFDGVTAPALPLDWSKVVSAITTYAYVQTYTTSTPRSAPNHIYMTNSSDAAANLILISPPIDPELNTIRTRFWAKGSSGYVLNAGTVDTEGVFTLHQAINLSSTYAEYTVDFSSYEGSNKQIAFQHGLGGTYRSIYIDDLMIEAIPTTPVFTVNPTTKNFGTVAISSSISQVFTVTNTGLGTLTIASSEITGTNSNQFTLTDANSYPVYLDTNQSITLTAVFIPNIEGNLVANLTIIDDLGKALHNVPLEGVGTDAPNAGGGDTASTAGGYYFANNVSISAPTQPGYSWVQQTTNAVTETPTGGSLDDGYWTVPIGFEFMFYGNVYSSLNICTNGFVNFGTGVTTYSNTTIPAVATPNNAIYLFWDDLEYYPGFSNVYYGGDANSFTITYSDMGRTGADYNPDASVTAQIVIYSNGKFQLSYQDITGTSATHTPTIGIENADGTKGIQYHYNGVGGPYSTDAKGGGVTIMFGENPQTLPVELTSFTATAMANSFVTISWMVASETDHLGYNILRNTANDLSNAIQINAEAISTGDQIGSQINYSYPDYEVEAGNNYYYWLQSLDMSGISTFFGPLMVSMTTGPQDPGTPAIPVVTSLNNAYPNPFNPNTTISYSMADAGNARIDIYNLRGQILRSFERDHANAGNYSFNWDGKDASGNFVGSGIYLYRMTSGNYSATKKLILSK